MALHSRHGSDSKRTRATPMDVVVLLLELSGEACTPHSLVPSSSKCGHHTKLRARAFIFEPPWCPAWTSSMTAFYPGSGTITLPPNSMQPLCKLSSSFLFRNGLRSSSQSSDVHPVVNSPLTFFRTLSSSVHFLMCSKFIGDAWSVSIISTVLPGSAVPDGHSARVACSVCLHSHYPCPPSAESCTGMLPGSVPSAATLRTPLEIWAGLLQRDA